MLQSPQNEVLTPWPGICALYNLPVSCCSPNCSMFQLAVLLAVAQALSVPSSLWACIGPPPFRPHLSHITLVQGLPPL